MSDATRQKELDQIAETVSQLGITADTPVDQLPPVVRDMLAKVLNAGVTDYPAKSFGQADLEGVWKQVGGAATTKTTAKVTKAATADGKVTPGEQKQIDGAASGASAAVIPDSPPWIYDMFGQAPTFEQQKRIANEWNTVFGTKYSYDELKGLPQFGDPTDTVQKVVQAAQLDIEPQVEYTVTLPGNRSYKITGDQQKTQFGLYGYDNKDVVRLVRWADTFGLKDSTGATAWQPLASLIKAKGLDLTAVQASQQHIGVPGAPKGPTSKSANDATKGHGARKPLGPKISDYQDGPSAGPDLSIAILTNDYNNALKKYGDPTLAYLGTLDSALAGRIVASGGDTTKISNQDSLLIQQYMLNGQWSTEGMAKMGYAGGSGLDAFLQRLAPPSSGSVRMKADPESLKQGVKDFYRTMFRMDPSEDLVNKMAGELLAGQAAAPDDQSFDVGAQLRKLAEGQPIYSELYGKKQAGQTEADYQSSFVAASGDLLGNESADNGAVLAGMRTGSYETTIGATAGSARAWQNSKFLGRLANAGQILNDRT